MSRNKKNKRVSGFHKTSKPSELKLESLDKLVINLPTWFKDERFLAFLLLVLAFLTYLISLNNEFIWDDVEVIQKTYFRFDRSSFFSGFIPSISGEKKLLYYRPVLALSYIFDWKLWKLNPLGFHLTNSVLYSLTVVAFYFVSLQIARIYNIRRSLFFSIAASLLFIYHPMHVESVSWVSGRTDILCGLFFLLAFGFHIVSYQKKYFLILSSFFLALSLFSKEVAVVFPFLVLGFDILNDKIAKKENIIKYLFYFGILFLYLYLRSRAFVTIPDVYNTDIESSPQSAKDLSYLFNILKVLVITYTYYFKQLILPYSFNAFVTSLPSGLLYFAASVFVIISTVIITLISYTRKEKIVTFSIYWTVLAIGPSALIAVFAFIATPVSERYLFVPSVGYCFLLSYLFLKIAQKYNSGKIGFIIASLVICSYIVFTFYRQTVWHDRISFWKDASSKSQSHAIPHINFGMALLDAGKTEEAIKEFHISLKNNIENTPTGRAIAANNLGVAYINRQEYSNAAKSLLIALKSDPSFYKTYYHFGLLYFIKANSSNKKQDYLTSEKYLLQAVSLYNNYSKALLLLAKLHVKLGNSDKSHYYATRALNSGLVNELSVQAQQILNNVN